MSITAAIRRMIASGLTFEQALIAAEAFEAEIQQEPNLTKRQARNKRYYDSRKASELRLNSDGQDVSDGQDAKVSLSSPSGSFPKPLSPNPHLSIPPSPPKGGSSPADEAIEAYSAMAKTAGLSAIRSVSGNRRRQLDARLRESGLPAVLEAIGKIGASAFCRGTNDRGWKADFDFLCQPKSFTALLEGKYDDRPRQQSQAPPRRETDFARHQRECTEALERSVYGDRHEQSTSGAADIDLEPGNWRAH